jgi:site-specific recombinase XerD
MPDNNTPITISTLAKAVIINPKTERPRRISRATQKNYHTAQKRLAEFFGPDRDITSIEAGELWDWQESLNERYANPVTGNTYRRTVRSMWGHLKKAGHNVCSIDDVFEMRKESAKVKAVNDGNFWRLLASSGVQDAAMAALLADSGMRKGGLYDMRISRTEIWRDPQNDELGLATVVTEKGDKQHIKFGLHMSASLLNTWLNIRKHFLVTLGVAEHDFVWVATDSGGRMSYETIGDVFDRLKVRAKIPKHEPANPHSFRHHFAIKRLLSGMPYPLLSKLMGHANLSTTEVYLTTDDEVHRAAFFDKLFRPDYNLT